MKKIRPISFLLLFIVVTAAGCTGVNIMDLNRELSSLHAQRVVMNTELKSLKGEVEASEEIRNLELMLADLDNNLIELGECAQSAAEKADQNGRDLDAIAFYRIGAVAALLGGAQNLTKMTTDGSNKCDRQKKGIFSAPRDCVMLKTIDLLAINAMLAPSLEKLAAEEKAIKALRSNPVEWIRRIKDVGLRDRTKDLFNKLTDTAVQIAEIYQQVKSPAVPVGDRFQTVLGLRAVTVACNAYYALIILDNLTLPDDFEESNFSLELKTEMRQWSQELAAARKLKADLDGMLIKEASLITCEGM